MKKLVLIFIFLVSLFSCEEVIDIELEDTETRLTVEGIIRVNENEEFVPVAIKVTESNNFFEQVPVTQVESAVIFYGVPTDFDPSLFVDEVATSSLAEVDPGSGIYVPDPNFSSDQRIRTQFVTPDTDFILQITHKGRRYYARSDYIQTVPIDEIEQGTETLFDEDDIEIKITITDEEERDDFYFLDFGEGEFLTLEDQFFQGQQFEFSYFLEQNIQAGEPLTVSILGADQSLYNYIDSLIEQTDDTGGVFQTPVATIRGNIFDITDLDNIDLLDNVEQPDIFPLGYFAVVQAYEETIIITE